MRTLVLSVEDHVNYLDGRCPASLENTWWHAIPLCPASGLADSWGQYPPHTMVAQPMRNLLHFPDQMAKISLSLGSHARRRLPEEFKVSTLRLSHLVVILSSPAPVCAARFGFGQAVTTTSELSLALGQCPFSTQA